MSYIGRRIGKSQDTATDPGDGTGGGLLSLFTNGYFQRQGNIYNAPGLGPAKGLTATGGVISDYMEPGGDIYRAHIFTSSGTFEVTELGTFGDTVDYLVVAGGGGGGCAHSDNATGGGGAGGLRSSHPDTPSPMKGTAYPVSTTNPYTVTVGAGGVALVESGYSRKGNNSEFYPTPVGSGHPTGIFAHGGGAGAGHSYTPASEMNGGSGGGGDTYAPPQPQSGGSTTSATGHGPTVQGFAGGPSQYGPPGNGGGGGGGAGEAGNTDGHGFGGDGLQIKIAGPAANTTGVGALNPGPGEYQWFAGGGGGEYSPGTGTPGRPGGVGGGGDASTRNADTVRGLYGTGGGGAATKNNPGTHNDIRGHGGSGIVIVRYQIGTVSTAKATGGAISFYGGKTIHTFTHSGTFETTSDWSPTNVEYVVVGGGGAGNGGSGPSCGGGGGAGGFITNTNHPIGTHPVSVTVQVGGGAAASPNTQVGGTPSYFGTPITAYGGGGGGRHINGGGNPFENGQPGGSGGGECDSQGPIGAGLGSRQTGTTTPTPITPQGNPGGAGAGNGGVSSVSGGGGGGAGQAGQDATDQGPGGDGGYGKQLPSTFQNPASATSLGTSPNPTRYAGPNSGNYWFAGGGGGASSTPPSAFGLDTQGGLGGGGRGFTNPGDSLPTARDEMDAIQNTGGGGGAFHGPAGGTSAGSGGSGIVLIAYPS